MKFTGKYIFSVTVFIALMLFLSADCFAENSTYLLLGDSIAVGTGTLNPSVQCYGWIIGKEKEYTVKNMAVNGYTSSDLLEYINNPDVVSSVKTAEVISISIGGNDFLHSEPLKMLTKAKLTGNFSEIEKLVDGFEENCIKTINTILGYNPDALIVLQTLYNPFFDQYSDPCEKALDIFNSRVNKIVSGYQKNVIAADAHEAFAGHPEYIADDSIHPNEAGHKALAVVVGNAIDDYKDGGSNINFSNIKSDSSTVLKLIVAVVALTAAFATFIYYRKNK